MFSRKRAIIELLIVVQFVKNSQCFMKLKLHYPVLKTLPVDHKSVGLSPLEDFEQAYQLMKMK
jgi:hypothetical protein